VALVVGGGRLDESDVANGLEIVAVDGEAVRGEKLVRQGVDHAHRVHDHSIALGFGELVPGDDSSCSGFAMHSACNGKGHARRRALIFKGRRPPSPSPEQFAELFRWREQIGDGRAR
jgi:hypothetical protein